MSIVDSTYTIDAHEQVGGGRYVIERHEDSAGGVHFVGPYLLTADESTMAARLQASAARLAEVLADAEVDALLVVWTAPQMQTAAQFAARFWRLVQHAYRDDNRLLYHFLVWWIWTRIQAGDFTSGDVRVSFNTAFGRSLNTTQWNNLVSTRFVPMKDRYVAFLAEGEL